MCLNVFSSAGMIEMTSSRKDVKEPVIRFFFNRFIETNCPIEPIRGKEPNFPSREI